MQAHSFELQDPIRGEVAYVRGGLVTQVKEPKQLSFRSLADVCTSYPSTVGHAGHRATAPVPFVTFVPNACFMHRLLFALKSK